jgi:hypothetical protein
VTTTIRSGAARSLALTPSTLVADGRGRVSTGGYPAAGPCAQVHAEKTGFMAGATASNAQTTDLRGIPPRGSAPV